MIEKIKFSICDDKIDQAKIKLLNPNQKIG